MILVTGATGLVGGALARALKFADIPVLASGRRRDRGQALESCGIAFRPASLEEPGAASRLCRGCRAVVHCAALSSPWGTAAEFQRANVEATARLLEASVEAGVEKFVYLSTAGVYFRGDEGLMVSEKAPLPTGPQHPYVTSKRRAEELVSRLPLPYLIFRPRAIYGPADEALLPRLLRLMGRGRLPILGRGDNLASLTYVDNLVYAIQLGLAAGSPAGRIYNISDGEPVRLWALFTWLAHKLGLAPPRRRLPYPLAYLAAAALEAGYGLVRREPPLSRYTLALLCKSQTLDIGAAQRELGYQPRVDTWEGVRRTIS